MLFKLSYASSSSLATFLLLDSRNILTPKYVKNITVIISYMASPQKRSSDEREFPNHRANPSRDETTSRLSY